MWEAKVQNGITVSGLFLQKRALRTTLCSTRPGSLRIGSIEHGVDDKVIFGD